MPEFYQVIGSGIDYNGWFKMHLRRDDGREIKVTRARLAELRRRRLICDCQAPVVESGAAGVSEDCPIHAGSFVVCSTVI